MKKMIFLSVIICLFFLVGCTKEDLPGIEHRARETAWKHVKREYPMKNYPDMRKKDGVVTQGTPEEDLCFYVTFYGGAGGIGVTVDSKGRKVINSGEFIVCWE